MSETHTLQQFQSYPWDSDEKWLKYKENLMFPVGREDDSKLLNIFKKKWYEKNIAKIEKAPKELIHLKDESQFQSLISGNELTIVDWTATWCGPCKMITPHIEKLAKETDNVTFVKVDINQFKNLAGKHQISSVPTFFFYKNGELLHQLSGANLPGIQNAIATYA